MVELNNRDQRAVRMAAWHPNFVFVDFCGRAESAVQVNCLETFLDRFARFLFLEILKTRIFSISSVSVLPHEMVQTRQPAFEGLKSSW